MIAGVVINAVEQVLITSGTAPIHDGCVKAQAQSKDETSRPELTRLNTIPDPGQHYYPLAGTWHRMKYGTLGAEKACCRVV